jgi:Arc/MetJ family transcription regulator
MSLECIDGARWPAYDRGMRKHTTMDLDTDLVAAAAGVLGTTKIVDTVHAALSEVVRSRRRAGMIDFRPALDLEDLDAMRAHRFAEARAPYGSKPE